MPACPPARLPACPPAWLLLAAGCWLLAACPYSLLTNHNLFGSKVDTSPPSCGKVLDGAGVDWRFVGPTALSAIRVDAKGLVAFGHLTISWDGFADWGSGIEGYSAAVVPATQTSSARFVQMGLAQSFRALPV